MLCFDGIFRMNAKSVQFSFFQWWRLVIVSVEGFFLANFYEIMHFAVSHQMRSDFSAHFGHAKCIRRFISISLAPLHVCHFMNDLIACDNQQMMVQIMSTEKKCNVTASHQLIAARNHHSLR